VDGGEVKLYVMTRSATMDYAFVGDIPADQWWNRFSDLGLLFPSEPAVALRGAARRWSAALFGVPSQRVDRSGRRIRYTVIVESKSDDTLLAVRLVRLALDAASRAELGLLLDEIYPEELVGRLFTAHSEAVAPDPDTVAALLREQAEKQPATIPPQGRVAPPWAGSADQPRARDAFVAHAARLADGTDGLCLVAFGAATAQDAEPAVDLAGPQTALLLPNATLPGLQGLKKTAAAPTNPRPWATLMRAAALGAVVLLVVFWLLRRL
jgi:hypothetical protein